MRISSTSGNSPVPILSIHVNRTQVPTTAGRPIEYTETDLENYFVTPDDARAGQTARKLTFSEAIQFFIV